MNKFAKTAFNAINKQIAVIKDSYLATTLIGGTAVGFYMANSYKQKDLGNRKASIAMATYAGIAIHNTGKVLLEKYQRDNRKKAFMSAELVDELVAINNNATKFKAELEARTVETYKGYPVVVWDDYVALQLQIPASLPMCIACLYNHKTIIMSQAAYDQDRDTVETVFEHEIGHMVLGHSVDHSDPLGLEFEADEYAYDQGKDIVKALRKLRLDCIIANIKYGHSISITTLNQRIAVARSLSL